MDGKVYVVTHKKVNIVPLMNFKEYELIQTGDIKAEKLGYQTAVEGINIANENEFYSELTILYRI